MTIIYSGGLPTSVSLSSQIYSWSPDAAIQYGSSQRYGWDTDTGEGISLHPDDVWASQPALRTVVRVLSRNYARVGLHVFERNNDDRIRVRGSALDLLSKNPSTKATAFKYGNALITDLCLWDRAASILTYDETNKWQLTRWPPRNWYFIRDGLDQPTAIIDMFGNEHSLDRIVWFDGYPTSAASPMETLKSVLIDMGESQAAKRDLWKGRARIPGVIERPASAPQWSPKARDNFRKSWSQYAAAGNNTGKTPILEDDMTYKPTGMITPEAAQQLESYKFNISEIASFYSLPPAFAGLMESTNYSNLVEFKSMLHGEVLGTWYEEVEQTYNAQIVPVVAPGEDLFVEHNVAAMMRMSFELQAKILAQATGAPNMTRNEARQVMNLPAKDGADDLVEPINIVRPD